MSTLVRVKIPDPMAGMWARLQSTDWNDPPEAAITALAWMDNLCPSQNKPAPGTRWICTRRNLHTGRHYASDGEHILAIWD